MDRQRRAHRKLLPGRKCHAHGPMSAVFWTSAEHHPAFDTENNSEPIVSALSVETVFRENAKTKHTNKKTPNHRRLKKKTCSKRYLLGTENFRPCPWNPGHVGRDFCEHERCIPNQHSRSIYRSRPRKRLEDDTYFLST